MQFPHTAQPRVFNDALTVLADPQSYPQTLVQLARLMAYAATGRTVAQRHRDPIRRPAPLRAPVARAM